MSRRPTVDALCNALHNEEPHTLHVTRLALTLFDRTHRAMKVPVGDRRLLEAAARLHDVGYHADPLNHAEAGADTVLRDGVDGFSAAQCRTLAAVIVLHPKQYRKALESPRVSGLPNRQQVLRLAAYLRVADGLDHGHIQDAALTTVRCTRGRIRVAVESPGYGGNIPWATAKTDLWDEVMPATIELVEKKKVEEKPLFEGVVRPGDAAVAAVRRILYSQYRVVADNRAGALLARDPEPLHDIRVAVRRFRSGLRFFRKVLAATSAPTLDNELQALNRKLGPVRDADVWLAFLARPKVVRELSTDPAWEAYLAVQQKEAAEQTRVLKETLQSEEMAGLLQKMVWFLRVELCDLARTLPPEPFAALAAAKLRRTFQRIMNHAHLRKGASPEEMHELRRLCRRERYWAEFGVPVLGPPVVDLARRLKAIADALGDLHDTDVGLGRLTEHAVSPPLALASILGGNRRKVWDDFEEAWEKLHRKKFQKRVVDALSRARKGKKR